MNIPETIERAILEVIRNKGAGANVLFRCWHSLRADTRWKPETDRTFPCIDIRTTAPKTDDNGVTLTATTQILIATKVSDDKDHSLINAQEAAVQEALDELYAHYRSTGTIFDAFLAQIETDCAGVSVGGLEFGDSLPPVEENGVNIVGITFIVHYSRSEF